MSSEPSVPESLFAQAIGASDEVHRIRELLCAKAAERRIAVSALRAAGASYAEIADRLGCTRSAVQSILRGAPPGHLPG